MPLTHLPTGAPGATRIFAAKSSDTFVYISNLALAAPVAAIRDRLRGDIFRSWSILTDASGEVHLKINRTIYVGKYASEDQAKSVVVNLMQGWTNHEAADSTNAAAYINNYEVTF